METGDRKNATSLCLLNTITQYCQNLDMKDVKYEFAFGILMARPFVQFSIC
jgi:hypothetical protein